MHSPPLPDSCRRARPKAFGPPIPDVPSLVFKAPPSSSASTKCSHSRSASRRWPPSCRLPPQRSDTPPPKSEPRKPRWPSWRDCLGRVHLCSWVLVPFNSSTPMGHSPTGAVQSFRRASLLLTSTFDVGHSIFDVPVLAMPLDDELFEMVFGDH